MFVRKAGNPMIGGSRMGNIGSGKSRHVALDTAVLLAFQAADVDRQLAAVILMASLATLPIIVDFLGASGVVMRIMAGNASQFVTTGLKATAGIHLFDVAHGFLLVKQLGWTDINGNKCVQGQAGTIICQRPIPFFDTVLSLEMTLLAHPLAHYGFEATWVDDRVIEAFNFRVALPFPNVDFPGTMTALAADGIALENR